MVGTKRTEAFEGVVNLFPEIISRDADMAPWDGAIAQFEPRLIAERTRDGVAAARAEGRHPGRPKLDQEKLRAALTLIRNGMSHEGGPSRRPRPINPLPRACAHTRRTARSGLAGIMEQRTSEPL